MRGKLQKLIRYFHIGKVKLIRLVSKKRRQARPAKQEEKWATITEAKNRGNIGTFVETGTYLGDTVEHLKHDFEKIYSIEVGPELAEAAKRRFTNDKNVEIWAGDSAEVLPAVLAKLAKPALFWLDAHCSEGDTSRGADYSPVISELRNILSAEISHTVLIDDARLFDGVNYPTLGKIKRLVADLQPKFSCLVKNDLILIQKNND